MTDLKGKTLFITGASRGIGRAIALRAARDGANVVLASKTEAPHPRLPGTIGEVAAEAEALGGRALALRLDIRDAEAVAAAAEAAAAHFGGIDILVNNASAIALTRTAETSLKSFDLMVAVNLRGTFAVTRACLPALGRAENPHVLTLSPPPSLDPAWYGPHVAYTVAKMDMSLLTLGWAEEFRPLGIAANALWPATLIDTAAIRMLGGAVSTSGCRRPEIVADAAHAILVRPARETSGNFFIDEAVLRAEGVADFSAYAVTPGAPLTPDAFLPRPAAE